MTKDNVRYIDETLFRMAGVKPIGLFRLFFIKTKRYNDLVQKKFSALDEVTKARIYKVIQREAKHRRKAWKRAR